jgi:hypothetical protein
MSIYWWCGCFSSISTYCNDNKYIIVSSGNRTYKCQMSCTTGYYSSIPFVPTAIGTSTGTNTFSSGNRDGCFSSISTYCLAGNGYKVPYCVLLPYCVLCTERLQYCSRSLLLYWCCGFSVVSVRSTYTAMRTNTGTWEVR